MEATIDYRQEMAELQRRFEAGVVRDIREGKLNYREIADRYKVDVSLITRLAYRHDCQRGRGGLRNRPQY